MGVYSSPSPLQKVRKPEFGPCDVSSNPRVASSAATSDLA